MFPDILDIYFQRSRITRTKELLVLKLWILLCEEKVGGSEEGKKVEREMGGSILDRLILGLTYSVWDLWDFQFW